MTQNNSTIIYRIYIVAPISHSGTQPAALKHFDFGSGKVRGVDYLS